MILACQILILFQRVIKSDPDIGYQVIKPADYDSGDMRCADELTALWETVKNLFLNARDCKDCNRDENAWCHDVLQPLIHLVIRMYGNDHWWFQSVCVQFPLNSSSPQLTH